jgi:hypothetical protein
VLLSRPMPKLIHKQMALKKELPPNSGRIARYRRYTNLATATVPLPDSGLTPPGQVLNAVDIDKMCVDVKPSVIDLELLAA